MKAGDFLSEGAWPPPPIARLALLIESLTTQTEIAPHVQAWLLRALIHYLHHGGTEPLDRFLGLAPINAGERSLATRLCLLKRDMILSSALDQISLDESLSDWGRCLRLEKEIASFEAHAWPIHKRCRTPPDGWPVWKRTLFEAFQTGSRIPRTARGLYDIRKQVKGISVQAPGIKLLTSLTDLQRYDKHLVQHQSLEQ